MATATAARRPPCRGAVLPYCPPTSVRPLPAAARPVPTPGPARTHGPAATAVAPAPPRPAAPTTVRLLLAIGATV